MNNSIKDETAKLLIYLEEIRKNSTGKALLSKLRNSIGKSMSEFIDSWSFIVERIPPEFLGKGEYLSIEEKTLVSTLQLYSMHQQGIDSSVNTFELNSNMGVSLRSLRRDEKSKISVERRFNSMVTSTTYDELIVHLKSLIKILKSKCPEVRVNYSLLSNDLYWFLRGNQSGLRLNWSREFYKKDKGGDHE